MSATPTQVGTFTITQPTRYTTRYETAAWGLEVEVPAGTYPVMAYVRWSDGRRSIGHSLYVKADGVVVSGFIASSIGGRFGRNEAQDRIGETAPASISFRAGSFPTDAEPTPYTQVVTIDPHTGETREVPRETVPVESLDLPDGLWLDPAAVFVEWVSDTRQSDFNPGRWLARPQIKPSVGGAQ